MSIENFDILEQNLKNQPGSDYFTEIKNRSIYKRTKCQSVIQKDDDCKFINPELEKAMKQVRLPPFRWLVYLNSRGDLGCKLEFLGCKT